MANVKQRVIMKFKDDSFVEQLSKLLMTAGKVKVNGLGIFEIRKVNERESSNIANGKRIVIPEHQKVVFRPTKQLRDSVQSYHGD